MLSKYRRSGGTGEEGTLLDDSIHYRSTLPLRIPDEKSDPWLFKSSGIRDEEFLTRERFKILADFAGDNSRVSPADRLRFASDAYKLAVRQDFVLIGAPDLARWETIEATLLGIGDVAPRPSRVLQDGQLIAGHEEAMTLSLVDDLNPVRVLVDPEVKTAAAIVATIGQADAMSLKGYVHLQDNQVLVLQNIRPANVESIIKTLQSAGTVEVNVKSVGGIPISRVSTPPSQRATEEHIA
jgi:hypothetical protein